MKERLVTQDITDALFELLKAKELADITITELIKKAGVCRASFYRHFYLTKDVIRQYGFSMYEEINRTIPLEQGGIRKHLLAISFYTWTHRERLALIEKRGLYYLLEDPILEQCLYQLQRLNMWTNRYQAEFYAGGITKLIRIWVGNGCEESPQEFSDILCDLIFLDRV